MTFAQLYAYLGPEDEVSSVDSGRLGEAKARFMADGERQRQIDQKAARAKRHG